MFFNIFFLASLNDSINLNFVNVHKAKFCFWLHNSFILFLLLDHNLFISQLNAKKISCLFIKFTWGSSFRIYSFNSSMISP